MILNEMSDGGHAADTVAATADNQPSENQQSRVLDDVGMRAFSTMAQYREWCAGLPAYLGYRPASSVAQVAPGTIQ